MAESINCDRCGRQIVLTPELDPETGRHVLVGDYATDDFDNILCVPCIDIVKAEGTGVHYDETNDDQS